MKLKFLTDFLPGNTKKCLQSPNDCGTIILAAMWPIIAYAKEVKSQ